LANALFGEGRDRWSLIREKLTHVVNVAFSPCTLERQTGPITSRYIHNNSRNLGDRNGTPDQSGTTVISVSFFFPPDNPERSDGEIWVHENCGNRQSAEHDLGRIVIREPQIQGTVKNDEILNVNLVISDEGLLVSDPILEMKCKPQSKPCTPWRGPGRRLPMTWETSSLSFSNDMMDNVQAQLAEEMKALHHKT
jgi:hypothetical protein